MADQAWEAGQILIPAVAGEDLSGKQYRFVRLSGANTVSAISATTQVPVGVLQNDPESGEAAAVAIAGVSKVEAGGTVTAGYVVTCDDQGRVVNATAGGYEVGIAWTAASSAGELCTIQILPSGVQAS